MQIPANYVHYADILAKSFLERKDIMFWYFMILQNKDNRVVLDVNETNLMNLVLVDYDRLFRMFKIEKDKQKQQQFVNLVWNHVSMYLCRGRIL